MLKPLLVATHDLASRDWSRDTHGLANELIVNLTSYPPRYGDLAHTLKSLLTQSIKPDRVILWIAEDDLADLPEDVLALIKIADDKAMKQLELGTADRPEHGFELRPYPNDIRAYKKLVPALQYFPDAVQVTADDDILYHRHWLRNLVDGWQQQNCDSKTIVCYRAHGIRLGDAMVPLPYKQWAWEISGPVTSTNILATGGAGILYPPRSLAPEVIDEGLFREIAFSCDDIWFYAMAMHAGSKYHKIRDDLMIINWQESFNVELGDENVVGGGNDAAIQKLIQHFGGWFPQCTGWAFDGKRTYADLEPSAI